MTLPPVMKNPMQQKKATTAAIALVIAMAIPPPIVNTVPMKAKYNRKNQKNNMIVPPVTTSPVQHINAIAAAMAITTARPIATTMPLPIVKSVPKGPNTIS